MSIQNKKIAIVGGGPGGLTLARLLQMKDINVKVYERDINKNVRVQGATLDLHDNSGLAALKKAGLIDEFMQNYRPGADKLRILNNKAEILYDDSIEKQAEELGNEYFRPEIDRGPLRKILLDSLKENTVVWDSQYDSMIRKNDQWELKFKNGTSAIADIVIGADGANSKIRPLLSDIKPIYSGLTIIEGSVYNAVKNAPRLKKLLNGGKIFAISSEKSLILSAKGDGSISFYTGTKEGEFWIKNCNINFNDKSEVFEWFKKKYSDWDSIWSELFQSDEISFVPRPMYHFPLDQSWTTQQNLTILGDAAHRMPPYTGEGVNMAMLDALELAECLTDSDFVNVISALHHYEKEMLKRNAAITEKTLVQTSLFHSQNGLENLLEMFKDIPN